jgi:hypothetical protein
VSTSSVVSLTATTSRVHHTAMRLVTVAGKLLIGPDRSSHYDRRRPAQASRRATSEFVVIGLFKRFKLVDSLKNSVDPRRNEFAI